MSAAPFKGASALLHPRADNSYQIGGFIGYSSPPGYLYGTRPTLIVYNHKEDLKSLPKNVWRIS
jgi:hypothetical protein